MISNLFHRFANVSSSDRRRAALAKARRSKLRKSLRPEPLEDRRLLAGIFGYKFEDLNANGIEDPGDPRLNGIQFDLLLNGNPIATTFSGDFDLDMSGAIDPITESGLYRFTDLDDGTGLSYQVIEVLPPTGVGQTTANPPALVFQDPDEAFVATQGLSGSLSLDELIEPTLAIGNAYAGSIHGFKFNDLNANGFFDPNTDLPLSGVEFSLTGITGQGMVVVQTTLPTDANGEFWFTNLFPGTYTVTETVPNGFVATTSTSQTFTIFSRQELAWQDGAAMLPDPPAPQVDQQQLQSNTEFSVGGNSVVAQTFTPGITGALTQVDIVVSVETAVAGDVMMEIRTLNDPGNPTSGAILRSVTVSGAGVPVRSIQTLSFDFSLLPPMLVNGLTYAMVLRSPTSAANNLVWRSQVQSDPYAGGAGFESNDDVASWNPVNGDQVFTTTMQPQGDPRIEVVPSTPELLFGNTISSSIHGFKFEDLDADGIYEPQDGELPQSNVPFQLTGVNSLGQFVNLITNTDASGQFWFEDLLPSVFDRGQQSGYTVTEIVPFGFYPTTDILQRKVDLPSGVELAWQTGAAMLGPNDPQQEVVVGQELIFGNTASVSIHGFKFEDIDGDGQFDPNDDELPLAGVPFTLTGTDGQGNVVNQTEFTDSNGEFWFTGREVPGDGEGPEDDFLVLAPLLPSVAGQGPGTGYTVTETVPTGFVSTTLPIARTFDLASRQELVWRDGAAMLPPAPVPQVDQTQQDNDVPDPLGETVFRAQSFVPGLTGGLTQVELSIEGVAGVGNVVLEIQTLNAAGNPSGSVLASATVPSANVPVGSNQTISFDFSVAPPTLLAGASYAMVLSSPNSNSQIALGWDSSGNNDPYASGVSFRSGDSGANWILFADFDHVFTTFILPQADPRVEVLATANGGLLGDQLMFGNTVPGSFHGFKFIDLNRNGLFDPNFGELPQSGVEFQLTGTDGLGNPVNLTETTNPNGEFWFVDLLPSVAGEGLGTGYTITEIVPAGFVSTTAPLARTFDLGSRQELVWRPGAAMLSPRDLQVEVLMDQDESGFDENLMWGNLRFGQIHGFKFNDLDGDGVQEPGEPRLAGFEIQLLNAGGAVIATEVTNDNGEYWFVDLEPGTYLIREVQQPGYLQTTHDPQPITITVSEVYVAHAGLGMLGPDDPRVEIVEKCLIFGNQPTGEIEWRKETKTGLLGGVIFELTRTHSYSITTGLFTDILDEPITVVDNLLPDTNPTFGLFAVKDLELGRYTLRELIPVPGYDPDLFVETFEITYDDRFQDATHIFFNTWSKRAFVGSTVALRLAYLEQIGMAEATLNQQQLEQTALQTGTAAETEQFRVGINVGESSGSHHVVMLHAASGILIAEGELTDEFAVVTTDLAEHVKINSMPNHGGSLRITTAGGDDIIDVASSDFDSLDAGEGEDVLRVLADGTFDLTTVVNRLAGVEEIALAGEGEQQIRLDRASVNAASTNQPLRVRTQRSGQLNVDGSWKIAAPIRTGNDVVQVIRSGNSVVHIVNQMPFQNVLNRFDVDGGGSATALDALQIINGIGRAEGQRSPENELSSKYFDVNGDGQWTALDALQVINSLYRNRVAAEGELVIASAPAAQDQAHNTAIAQYDRLDDQMQEFGTEKMVGEFAGAANSTASAFDAYGQSDSDNQDDEEFDLLLTILAGGPN